MILNETRKKGVMFFLLVSIFIFTFSFTSAKSEITSGVFETGYTIKTPEQDVITQYDDYKFHIHLFNTTNGALINNASTDCLFHLYNNQGSHLVKQLMTYKPEDAYNEWSITIDGNNFSEVQEYSYIVQCNSSANDEAGYTSVLFEVTSTGFSANNQLGYILLITIGLYSINLIGFFKRNAYITILGGIGLTFLGLYFINNGIIIYRDNLTLVLSYITLFWGVGSALWASVETIGENF